MYVDIETGTVLNGPIYFVSEGFETDEMSDSEVSEKALTEGVCVLIPS